MDREDPYEKDEALLVLRDGAEEIQGKNIPEGDTGPVMGQYCPWRSELHEVTEVTGGDCACRTGLREKESQLRALRLPLAMGAEGAGREQ